MSFVLEDELAGVLLQSNTPYHLLNLQSFPKQAKSIVHHHHADLIHSFKAVHFLTLFEDKLPVLALEVYVYLDVPESQANVLRTVYISKADTSGLHVSHRVNVGAVVRVLLRWLLTYPIRKYFDEMDYHFEVDREARVTKFHDPFVSETDRALHILVERARGNTEYGMPKVKESATFKPSETLLSDDTRLTTRLVLFTRSESQYLFPNSADNADKHILTDSGLLKWWMKNVEQVLGADAFVQITKKRVNILNEDSYAVRRYIPRDSEGWQIGNVYSSDPSRDTEPAVYYIPLLPDDPKGRFLEHLVVDNRIKKVRLRQYWLELSVRQEFSLGVTVGLIGVEGVTRKVADTGKISVVKRSQFNKIKDLIVEVDYADPLDYELVYSHLKEKVELAEIRGVAEK